MTFNWKKARVCCLCGEEIDDKETREDWKRSKAHVPPRQFYPKELRDGLNLWTAAAHNRCNNDCQKNEDYFYAQMYPQVAMANPDFAKKYLADVKRQAEKPQMRARIQAAMDSASTKTAGGVHLPHGIIQWNVETVPIHQVAISIAQGLSQYHDEQILTVDSCVDLHRFTKPEDTTELYQMVHDSTEELSVDAEIFSYHRRQWEDDKSDNSFKSFTLLFWNAFLFGLTFQTSHRRVFPR